MEIIERFWNHVQRCAHGTDCTTCCWLWQGVLLGWGYVTLGCAALGFVRLG